MQIQSVLVTIGALAATAAAKPNHLPFKHKDGSLAIVNGTIVTLTRVHQQVETWCPEPTTLYFNNRTYKIDKPTTFKIPDCPCTEIYTTNYDHGYYPTGVVPPAPAPPVETGVPGTECGGSPCPGPAPTGPAVPPQVPGQSGAPGPAPSAPAVPGTPGTPSTPGTPATPGGEGGDAGNGTECGGAPCPTHVVVAGAEKQAALAGSLALIAGAVAVFAL